MNIVTYYAPTLFEVSLGMSQERSLFFGCWVQVWYMIASFVTVSISLHSVWIVSDATVSTVVHDRSHRSTEVMDHHGLRTDDRPHFRSSLCGSKQYKLEYRCGILHLPVRDMFHMGSVRQPTQIDKVTHIATQQGGWRLCGCIPQRSHL